MQYIIAFLEGIITFISPCFLPMLPIYISYLAGGEKSHSRKTLTHLFGFVVGFSSVFLLLGALAGGIGSFLKEHQSIVNIASGAIVVFFGLHFMGLFQIKLFHGGHKTPKPANRGFFSAMLFGMVFSLSWTPCVGVFLGSALMMVSQQGHVLEGMLMLLLYSIGLGIPFVLSGVLIDYTKSTFGWIKNHYIIINKLNGIFLVIVGILMATGTLGKLLGVLG